LRDVWWIFISLGQDLHPGSSNQPEDPTVRTTPFLLFDLAPRRVCLFSLQQLPQVTPVPITWLIALDILSVALFLRFNAIHDDDVFTIVVTKRSPGVVVNHCGVLWSPDFPQAIHPRRPGPHPILVPKSLETSQ